LLEITFTILAFLVFVFVYIWPPKNQRLEDKIYGGAIALFVVSLLFYFIE